MRKFFFVVLVLILVAAAFALGARHRVHGAMYGRLGPPPPPPARHGPPLALPLDQDCVIHLRHGLNIASKSAADNEAKSPTASIYGLHGSIVRYDKDWVVVTDDHATEHWVHRDEIENIDVYPAK